ncbi:hypothetical protein ACFLZI_02685, partial [Nitrospirota bacterium]
GVGFVGLIQLQAGLSNAGFRGRIRSDIPTSFRSNRKGFMAPFVSVFVEAGENKTVSGAGLSFYF